MVWGTDIDGNDTAKGVDARDNRNGALAMLILQMYRDLHESGGMAGKSR